MKRIALVVSISTVVLAAWAVAAQELTEVDGVSFTLPANLTAQPIPTGPTAVAKFWKDSADTISLAVAVSESDGAAMVREMADWPSVGDSFVKGFGNSNVKSLSKTYGVECSFSGTPLLRDLSRAMMEAEATTTCPTGAAPTVFKTRLIVVATRSKQVLFRIDALSNADASAAKAVADLWNSITIAESVRLAPSGPTSVDVVDHTRVSAVTGGRGVHFESYDTIRTAALVGEAIGTLVGALLFGWLFTVLLMWLGLRPPYAAVVAQLICIGLAVWGNEHHGNWTLSPAMWIANALAAAILLVPARRRWAKKHPTAGALDSANTRLGN